VGRNAYGVNILKGGFQIKEKQGMGWPRLGVKIFKMESRYLVFYGVGVNLRLTSPAPADVTAGFWRVTR